MGKNYVNPKLNLVTQLNDPSSEDHLYWRILIGILRQNLLLGPILSLLEMDDGQSDCVVFVLYKLGFRIYISNAEENDSKISSVVYGEGKNGFYCVFPGGILGKFGISDRSWSFISIEGHGLEQRRYHHLFRYKGELILVVKDSFYRFHTFRFDWSAMKWIPVSGVHDKKSTSHMDFEGFLSKNKGNGAFLCVNLHYSNAPNVCWIDLPSFGQKVS
ncbi:OLC1v1000517C1 [Oldenlandia corymbosa var. corymbosa]|uniref:OLC1v1000517C1 n=1 Tax=Oldenlandia corymbosa var. corymbosa TaxID=529605 RepID=A0AAV1D4K2_OLDCO|nr:OLC1v1000517C1 [Oldenlandia corymbosa var. corymbosa]